MAINQDADVTGVPISVSFTESSSGCLPPNVIEALKTANWRATLPTPSASGNVTMVASTLQDNIASVDSQGAIYVPGFTIIELVSQTVTIPTSTAENVPTEVKLSAPGVTDLKNYIDNVVWEIEPPSALVYVDAPRINGNQYVRDVYRQTGETGEIVIRMYGRLIRIPSIA